MRLASLFAAASMMALNTAPVIAPPAPRLPKPPHVRLMDRRTRNRLDEARKRWRMNDNNRLANARNRRRERSELQAAITSLANWQRNQWARAGYPGLKANRPSDVRNFATMRRGA